MGQGAPDLHSPYVDNLDDPGHIETAEEYMASHGLTTRERRLVDKGVEASRRFAANLASRCGSGWGRGSEGKYKGPTAEKVFNEAGVPLRRQIVLFHAVVKLGTEQGVDFNVGRLWAAQNERRRKAREAA